MYLVLPLVHTLLVASLSPLLVGCVRKLKARYQGREGASVLQPYRDLRKLFGKGEVLPRDASWVFRITPYLVFATSLLIAAGTPLLLAGVAGTLGNAFVFIYTLALGTFFLALAGVDAGSAFGGFGSSREMSLSSIAEGVLLFSLVPLMLLAQSADFGVIALHVGTLPATAFLPVVVAGFAYFIALLAETGRIPVDNPATHLELTMIHEAMILEYSGPRLALIEWANANKLFVFLALAGVFIPWGLARTVAPAALLGAVVALVVKVGIGAFVVATIESVIGKLRIFRVPHLLFTGIVMGAVAIVIATTG